MKPRLLDLFCCAGGAGEGYRRAGFHVTGVDIRPQPNYAGDEFHQADAMTFPLEGFDAIHASPPCQAFTTARVIHGNEHADLLTPTRERLREWGGPWVIENVPGAPMRKDLVLCGSMFPELRDGDYGLVRHRWFEFDTPPLILVPSCWHDFTTVSVFGHGGHIYHGVEQWRRVMGMPWAKRDEIAQAIPPPYTELVGAHLLERVAGGVREAA